MPPTFAELLREAQATLARAGAATPRLDAEVLLAAAMDASRAELYARLPERPPDGVRARFAAAVQRRARREPVAYITGMQEFWSLPFAVTPEVLIPRPETELLVEAVRGLDAARVCDVGTGSGCIAVAVACEMPEAAVVGTDVSPGALAVAARNAAAHGLGARLRLVRSDLFAALDPAETFDVVVSNPPYIAEDEGLPPDVAWEPAGALRAGPDGLAVIRRLVAAAPARLRDGGWLILEFGAGQAEAVSALAAAAGFATRSVQPDLAGIPRVLIARLARGRDR